MVKAKAKPSRPKPVCPVEAYARSVVDGKTVAGRLVRLACERHLRDLVEGPKRGLKWDAAAAIAAIEFFSFLRLPVDGQLDGKAFDLEPFQKFIIGSIFGWKAPDGYRRFRTAYCEMGKGNGKSPLAGGIGLKGLVADGEAAAEIYAAATKREQANILFRDAQRMVEASPALRSRIEIGVGNMAYAKNGSFFRPVSSERRGLDGPRPHMGLIDEVHEHPDATVIDKIRAGTKSRRQALIFEITNSGYDRTTVCWHHHEFSIKVLEGVIKNDSWFAYVCGLDVCDKHRAEGIDQPVDNCPNCDDWRDEAIWPKANPGLGTIITLKYLREQVEEAKGMPTKEGIVKRLNFCIWTRTAIKAIPMDRWAAAAKTIEPGEMAEKDCYAGLDIGSTSDFTAFVLLFPHQDAEPVDVPVDATKPEGPARKIIRRSISIVPFFWLPESPARRDERTANQIETWRRLGFIRTTPGDVVDYDQVYADIVQLSETYRIRECGFDRGFQGAQIGTNLIAHFGDKWLFTVPQGVLSMNAPFREFIELLRLGRILHDGNPVMTWMCSNCASETKQGLIKPSKDLSSEKIDGVTAVVMGLARAMLAPPDSGDFGGYETW